MPFLDDREFIEPFAGVGDLVNELEKHGHKCSFACDNAIRTDVPYWLYAMDAFELTSDQIAPHYEVVISNPPWTRKILHRAIEHFAQITETWFLFDANWMFTKQAKPYLEKYCTDIVNVGRLIWIPGTKMSGKDDCCWYRFSSDKNEITRFHA